MKKLLAIFLCAIWMGFIFYNSSNDGNVSQGRSRALLSSIKNEYYKIIKRDRPVVQSPQVNDKNLKEHKTLLKGKLNKISSLNRDERLNKILRKNAHAFEYFILAILVSTILFSFNFKGRGSLIYIMFACLFYAVTDEFHQMFIPGRSSVVSDILIDFLGSLIGMAVFYLIYYKLYNSRSKQSKVSHN